jgi:hypothetical protein
MSEDALSWARTELPGCEIASPRTRPWSSVWRVRSGSEVWWLKVNGAETRYEPRLLGVLRGLEGSLLPRCVLHPREPWALVADAGTSSRILLADAGPAARADYWCAVLPQYAELQRRADPAELVAAGVPDFSAARLLDRFDALLADRPWYEPPVAPEVTAEQRAALRECRGRLATVAALLADALPAALQHDDLHDGNVFGTVGRIRVIDWGDAVLGHPFGTLLVTLGVLTSQLGVPADDPLIRRVRDAYLEPWRTAGESRIELDRQVGLAVATGPLIRAAGWRRALGTPEAAIEADFADAVAYWMIRQTAALATLG